jgi:hypothetical protein
MKRWVVGGLSVGDVPKEDKTLHSTISSVSRERVHLPGILDRLDRIASFHLVRKIAGKPGTQLVWRRITSMLPPFIIEQIRKREEEERKRYEQPQLDLPLAPGPQKRREENADEGGQRGVIIVEL